MRALLLLLASCGDNLTTGHLAPYFGWGDQQQVGAMSLDTVDATTDGALLATLPRSRHPDGVVMLYAHSPGETVSVDVLEAVLAEAQREHLPMLTYAELAAGGAPRSGISLSFDDNPVAAWFSLRDLLASYGAHVSFFVTEYDQLTATDREQLHTLYADGHSIEAHGVHHVDGPSYVAEHGLDAYLADEVVPSIDILRADGFAPVAFAHPGGARTDAIDAAILDHVRLVRGISSTPR